MRDPSAGIYLSLTVVARSVFAEESRFIRVLMLYWLLRYDIKQPSHLEQERSIYVQAFNWEKRN